MEYQTIIDTTSTPWSTYICKAQPWFASSEAKWQIKLIDANWNKKYPIRADGLNVSEDFEFIADNRASFTYAYSV